MVNIVVAAKKAYAHDFIMRLPEGYETVIGEMGVRLSGGERQRLAIARALVMNPAIILADEPTGNLDSKTSEEILALFTKLNSEGHTILIVTHEPDVASHCKRNIYLKDGRIIKS